MTNKYLEKIAEWEKEALSPETIEGAKAGATLGALGSMIGLGGMGIAGATESISRAKSMNKKVKLLGELALFLGAYGAAGAAVGAPIGAGAGAGVGLLKDKISDYETSRALNLIASTRM